jgi:hypothetical protein
MRLSRLRIMKIETISCGVLTVVVLAGGLSGCATGKHSDAKLQEQALILRSEAEQIALARVPNGAIKEGDIEKENGKLVWSFDIAKPGTANITEVQVDAMTGQVLSIEKEIPPRQSKEKKKN